MRTGPPLYESLFLERSLLLSKRITAKSSRVAAPPETGRERKAAAKPSVHRGRARGWWYSGFSSQLLPDLCLMNDHS